MTDQQPNTQQRPPLRRSSSDRVIAGVCGGLARTLGVDPVVIRVIAAVLVLLGGTGFAAYIIAWILIPNDDGESALDQSRAGRGRFPQFVLVLLLAIAGISLFQAAWPGDHGGLGFLVFILIAVVAWQAFGSDWFRSTSITHDSGTTGQTVTVDKGPDGQTVTVQTPAGTTVIRKEPKSVLGRIVWNLLAVAVGGMIALNWAGLTDISARMMLVVALVIVGLGLITSAFAGRARGLIALGLVLTLITAPAGFGSGVGVGDRTWTPRITSDGPVEFDLGVGTAVLDLRQLVQDAQALGTTDVVVRVGAGDLNLVLPDGANARYLGSVEIGAGQVQLPDQPLAEGTGLRVPIDITSGTGEPTINLDIKLGVGSMEVHYA